MYASNTTADELEQALRMVNQIYKGNVIWNERPQARGNRLLFTLRVRDSRGLGARLGFPDPSTGKQRHLPSACWHVHGNFFDALFKINPKAKITAGGKSITIDHGNWEDRNIGSQMQPMYFSEACECAGKGIA